jgi:hypothetical protein
LIQRSPSSKNFDQQVEHVHGLCGTVGVARRDCGS